MIRFRDTRFWKNYQSYDLTVNGHRTRSALDGLILWRMIQQYQFRDFVEIGVDQGLTTGLLLDSSLSAKVLGVDILNRLDLFDQYYHDCLPRFTFANQDSKAITLGPDTHDLALIDGDHSTESVWHDINICLPWIKEHGVLAVDDYTLPDVSVCLDRLRQEQPGWCPFLRTPQIEFWHRRSNQRGDWLDSLFTDVVSKLAFVYNETTVQGDTVCMIKTLPALSDHWKFFDLALEHYQI